MNEEGYIRERIGSQNPFRVPEGYFDDFTARLMSQLPDEDRKPLSRRGARIRVLRPLLYAAACLLVAVMCVGVYFNQGEPDLRPQASAVVKVSSDAYVDAAADYAMLENTDIYACLTDDY